MSFRCSLTEKAFWREICMDECVCNCTPTAETLQTIENHCEHLLGVWPLSSNTLKQVIPLTVAV